MKSMIFRGIASVAYMPICLSLFMSLSFVAYGFNTEIANEEHKHHTQHSRTGSHGMVLVTDGTELYASHLPLYVIPHDYQLVYLLESTHKAKLLERLTTTQLTETEEGKILRFQQNMVTLLPAKFDLNRLINGESFEIDAQFFSGHFERGGEKWFKEENLKFVRQVYKRSMTNNAATAKSIDAGWHTLTASNSETQLFIFPIKTSPSFDAIVLGTNCSNTSRPLLASFGGVPDLAKLEEAFSVCDSSQVLYFETQDFAR